MSFRRSPRISPPRRRTRSPSESLRRDRSRRRNHSRERSRRDSSKGRSRYSSRSPTRINRRNLDSGNSLSRSREVPARYYPNCASQPRSRHNDRVSIRRNSPVRYSYPRTYQRSPHTSLKVRLNSRRSHSPEQRNFAYKRASSLEKKQFSKDDNQEYHRERPVIAESESQKTNQEEKSIRNNNQKENEQTENIEKLRPNFALSGKLNQEKNTVNGTTLKYCEPEDSASAEEKFSLIVFKGSECIDTLELHRKSFFLIGRDRNVVDIPTDHVSCSKQHAVLQYRSVNLNVDGEISQIIRPYLIDLESTNGTFINGEQILKARYYELEPKDSLTFGQSTREYILMSDSLIQNA